MFDGAVGPGSFILVPLRTLQPGMCGVDPNRTHTSAACPALAGPQCLCSQQALNIILTTKPSCLSPCVRFWSSEYPSFIKQQCLHYYYTNSMCRVCTQVEEYIMMDAVWNHTTKEKSNLAYNLDIRICCFLYKSDTYFSVFFWLFKCPEDQRSFGAIEKNK